MILERLILVTLAFAIGILACYAWRTVQRRRIQQMVRQTVPDEVARVLPTGPALLYFTTANCAQCHFQQEPILAQLAATTTASIHTFDAIAHDPLARFFGILTVPTTIWLDQQRRPVAINHGVTSLQQLRQQAARFDLG